MNILLRNFFYDICKISFYGLPVMDIVFELYTHKQHLPSLHSSSKTGGHSHINSHINLDSSRWSLIFSYHSHGLIFQHGIHFISIAPTTLIIFLNSTLCFMVLFPWMPNVLIILSHHFFKKKGHDTSHSYTLFTNVALSHVWGDM